MSQAFSHDALPPGWIRVLQARDSGPKHSLHYDLISLPLVEAIENGYDALSYMWGDDSLLHSIYINDQLFHVRQNLFDFLQTARRLDWSNALWIDALSIDQNNSSERNRQVRMMTDIYKSANTVHAWLGQDDLGFGQFHTDNGVDNSGLDISVHTGRNLDFLLDLSASEYWQRAWIVQELTTAREICLRSALSTLYTKDLWNRLLDTDEFNDWLFRTASSDVRFQLRPMLNVLRRADRSYPQLQPFESIIHDFSNLRCSEPRDHIYAFHALFQDKHRRKLPIDYDISIPQLVSKVLECCETKTNLHSLFTILRAWKIDKVELDRDRGRLIHARLCPKMDDRFEVDQYDRHSEGNEIDLVPSEQTFNTPTVSDSLKPELEPACVRSLADAAGQKKRVFLPAYTMQRIAEAEAQSWCLILLDVQYDLYFTKPFKLRMAPPTSSIASTGGIALVAHIGRHGKARLLEGQPQLGVWLTEMASDADQGRYEQACHDLKSLWRIMNNGFSDAIWRYRSRSEITVGLSLPAWVSLMKQIRDLAREQG